MIQRQTVFQQALQMKDPFAHYIVNFAPYLTDTVNEDLSLIDEVLNNPLSTTIARVLLAVAAASRLQGIAHTIQLEQTAN
ncbi:hypothetical protein [Dictyobacter arantiisoli]|uniref:Uncharacterized protein n=1 Tax=Dictyobacter arantiisoli TaxID=2014874 RepID=A0A5A5TB12_9CHLR|nr:hypothetical protein [Dictyobacter arantiisoli]GCF08094.1 hypothetical protein KDI_16580 [Dictyobacter arantiisoli]